MESHKNIPTVCIVGRPNVGKSSLFNCLVGQRRAVVVEESGTTRDRVESIMRLDKAAVKIVDTGGYLAEDKDLMSMMVKEQIAQAMNEASAMVLVTDAISGVASADREITSLLRKFGKPVILVVNKTDNEKLVADIIEFYQLGIGEPIPVSCMHRRGIRRMRQEIVDSVKDVPEKQKDAGEKYLKIAVVGRPNVGKSSFVNNLLKRERVIVSPVPGTTRDSIDTHFSYDGDEYILIDTAGMRHKRKVKTVVDSYSMMRSEESIRRADVCVLLLDAADGVTRDDVRILEYIYESGKGCIVFINKWDLADLAEGVSADDYEKRLLEESHHLGKFPISFISAVTGKNVLKGISMAKMLNSNLDIRISTPLLNKVFEKNDPGKVSIPRSKKRPNFLYVIQCSSRPVEFKYFVNDTSLVLTAHLNYIENKLRESFPLKGIPIKLMIRKSRKVKKV